MPGNDEDKGLLATSVATSFATPDESGLIKSSSPIAIPQPPRLHPSFSAFSQPTQTYIPSSLSSLSFMPLATAGLTSPSLDAGHSHPARAPSLSPAITTLTTASVRNRSLLSESLDRHSLGDTKIVSSELTTESPEGSAPSSPDPTHRKEFKTPFKQEIKESSLVIHSPKLPPDSPSLQEWCKEFYQDAKTAVEQGELSWLKLLVGPNIFKAKCEFDQKEQEQEFICQKADSQSAMYHTVVKVVRIFKQKLRLEAILKLQEGEICLAMGKTSPKESIPANKIECKESLPLINKKQIAEYNQLVERYQEALVIYRTEGILAFDQQVNKLFSRQELGEGKGETKLSVVVSKTTCAADIEALTVDNDQNRMLVSKLNSIRLDIITSGQVEELKTKIGHALSQQSKIVLKSLRESLLSKLAELATKRSLKGKLMDAKRELEFVYLEPLLEKHTAWLQSIQEDIFIDERIHLKNFLKNRNIDHLEERCLQADSFHQRIKNEENSKRRREDLSDPNTEEKFFDFDKEIAEGIRAAYREEIKREWVSISESLPPRSSTYGRFLEKGCHVDNLIEFFITLKVGEAALGQFVDENGDHLLIVAARAFIQANPLDRENIKAIMVFLQSNGCSYYQGNSAKETPESLIQAYEKTLDVSEDWVNWTDDAIIRLKAVRTPCQLTTRLKQEVIDYCAEVKKDWPTNFFTRLFYNRQILCEIRRDEVNEIIKGLEGAWKTLSAGDLIVEIKRLAKKPTTGGLGRSRLYEKMILTCELLGSKELIVLPRTSAEITTFKEVEVIREAQIREIVTAETKGSAAKLQTDLATTREEAKNAKEQAAKAEQRAENAEAAIKISNEKTAKLTSEVDEMKRRQIESETKRIESETRRLESETRRLEFETRMIAMLTSLGTGNGPSPLTGTSSVAPLSFSSAPLVSTLLRPIISGDNKSSSTAATGAIEAKAEISSVPAEMIASAQGGGVTSPDPVKVVATLVPTFIV